MYSEQRINVVIRGKKYIYLYNLRIHLYNLRYKYFARKFQICCCFKQKNVTSIANFILNNEQQIYFSSKIGYRIH